MRETSRRQRLAIMLSSVAAIAASALSGCSGSAALPARTQAFRQAEIYINDVLLALHEQPTTQFTYLDGPCHETDDAHGGFDLEYTVPGTQRPAQVQAELKAVRSMMQSL